MRKYEVMESHGRFLAICYEYKGILLLLAMDNLCWPTAPPHVPLV